MQLYVHVPFCRSKCAYCGFYSMVHHPGLESRFTELLLREMAYWSADLGRPRLETVFFGGGTPSLLASDHLERIVAALQEGFDLDPDVELSLEANPDSVDGERLALWRDLGVTRISLGLQSLRNERLALLQRPHSAEQGLDAVKKAQRAGFAQVGADILWGLPGQSLPDWLDELRSLGDLGLDHVSCYGLSLEPGTALARRAAKGALSFPDEEEQAEMYLQGAAYLEALGLEHYEISNFARASRRCRHNEGYWAGRCYLGLGPGAVSSLSVERWENPRDMEAYAACVDHGLEARTVERLGLEEERREMILLRLRTAEGLSLAEYAQRTGQDLLQEYRGLVERLCAEGLMRQSGDRLFLSPQGMAVSNSILECFV